MKTFTSKNQKTGEIGEISACEYLRRKGFQIVERNHTKRWGELDIIAFKNGIMHFIEVKSVSKNNHMLRPEEQMHGRKLKKLMRTIEIYVNANGIGKWQVDLACVYLDFDKRMAKVKLWEDIIL